ncbi:MAG: RsmB/NOP family class I SAM-dependent RNA methyltransferase, partial [Pseudomonadota bacterium]
MSVLRLVTHEMLVDGVPPHAAVDGAVHLARAGQKTGRFTKLVNAVARRVAKTDRAAFEALPPPALPGWLAKPVVRSFGEEAALGMARAHAQSPSVDICLRDGTTQDWADRLGGLALPTGAVRLSPRQALSSLEGYDTGAWWVQDAAAQCPVALLGDIKGARVLDLCAAPGGKMLQLAAQGAEVTALDISEARLTRVKENLARTGLQAELVAADAVTWSPHAPFDAVLLDAPCSATGTLRRHPDLPFVRPAPDLSPLLQLQADLLDRALSFLRPGGVLVYATCSLLPREGERQIADALARNSTLARMPWSLPPGWEDHWQTELGDLRLRPDFWPELGGMDGFFAAKLTRTD